MVKSKPTTKENKMRKISLAEFKSETIVKEDGNGIKYKPYDILMILLRTPRNPAGINFEQMLEFIEVINAIKAAKNDKQDYFLLEEAQFKTLCESLKANTWNTIDPAIYNWIDSILNARLEAPIVK
ncbi:hypothetical protein EKK58_10595 [Candidatus Dependentiae bacterium]|nr:MAG: hypothetical protein EKK58_10595 [Candidatus Dependentiae bacterium]